MALNCKLPSSFKHSRHLTIPNSRNEISNFLNEKCKSGDFTLKESIDFFSDMIDMKPPPLLASFNILFSALVKKIHYDTNGYLSEALELFYDLEKYKSKLNIEFVSCLIDGLCRVRRLETA
ncbi:hypothetical protein WN944_014456 [Citrus x changshan-huyou]|uniref:Pentatricopeptide repeat-containing protein n=1 Tax=Citrus x changshan-huyou TaxID=2935761 RepID=A0AAP0M5N4_9ROSI